ncbi:LysM peptidoglycan-binding domain-containing protein [Planctomycetota bacterium]
MTSDAKIGLLLGLVFIFIIAFIINGLPGFGHRAGNNELTTTMVNSHNDPTGIASTQRKVSREIIKPALQPRVRPNIESTQPQRARFKTALPQSETTAAAGPKFKPIQQKRKPASPKFHIVCSGDTLASIAKKFYGDELGNKKINIDKIFAANRKLLKYQDNIYVGQKIVIPLLTNTPVRNSILETVKSVGKRHLLTKQTAKKYTVVEGDSLWRIAEQHLGNGARYNEIARLNADILSNSDSLSVGMNLKLPAR